MWQIAHGWSASRSCPPDRTPTAGSRGTGVRGVGCGRCPPRVSMGSINGCVYSADKALALVRGSATDTSHVFCVENGRNLSVF